MHTIPVVVQAAVPIAADLLVAIVVAAFVDNQQVRKIQVLAAMRLSLHLWKKKRKTFIVSWLVANIYYCHWVILHNKYLNKINNT